MILVRSSVNYLSLLSSSRPRAALDAEKHALGRVNEMLESISPSHAPQTRSQTAAAESRKRKRDMSDDAPSPAAPAVPFMKETPLTELFVDGMSDEQVWAELELRAEGVCELLNYALDGELKNAGDEEEEDSAGEDAARERKLKEVRQALINQGFDPATLEGLSLEDLLGEDDDEDSDEDDEDDEDEEEEEEEDSDEEDEEDEEEDASEDGDLGESVEELHDPSDDEDDDNLDVDEPSFLNGGKRTLRFKRKAGGHPILDDGFFDLAAFNAEVEAAESKNVSRGRLSKDDEDEDEDEEELDLFAPVDDTAAFEEEDMETGGGASLISFLVLFTHGLV